MILGHAHPDVIAAVQAAAARGTSFGAPTEAENELAKMVCDSFDSVDMVRFVSSGTEAAMSALRLARAFTGRDKILKFQGGYHGHADALLVAAGSGAIAHGVPDSAGVPRLLRARHADCAVQRPRLSRGPLRGVSGPDSLRHRRAGRRQHGRRAASARVLGGSPRADVTLPLAAHLRRGHHRLSRPIRGAQHLHQVTPDVTCLGKIIGGGMPVGAYGGRREIMERVSPLGPMYQAGTLSGNPVAMAAGTKTLSLLQTPGIYEELESKAARLAEDLQDAFAKAEVPLRVNRVGSMMTLFFNPGDVTGWPSVSASDREGFGKIFPPNARRGCVPTPIAFRGDVRVHRSHQRRHRRHRRGSRAGACLGTP